MKLYCCNFWSSSAPAIKPVLNLTETPDIYCGCHEIQSSSSTQIPHTQKKFSLLLLLQYPRKFQSSTENLPPNEWLFSCIYTTFSINYFEPTCHKLSLFLIIIILNIAGPTCHKISFYFYFVKKLHLWSRLLTINNLLFCFYLNLNFIYSML